MVEEIWTHKQNFTLFKVFKPGHPIDSITIVVFQADNGFIEPDIYHVAPLFKTLFYLSTVGQFEGWIECLVGKVVFGFITHFFDFEAIFSGSEMSGYIQELGVLFSAIRLGSI